MQLMLSYFEILWGDLDEHIDHILTLVATGFWNNGYFKSCKFFCQCNSSVTIFFFLGHLKKIEEADLWE